MFQYNHNIRVKSFAIRTLRNNFFFLLLAVLATNPMQLWGQGTKKMIPADYDRWYKIKNQEISSNGNTVIYNLEKETGDKILGVYNEQKDTSLFYPRVNTARMEKTGRFVVFTRACSYDSTRVLKRKKTPKDKMPQDSLAILEVATGQVSTVPGVNEFMLSERWPGYCFYLVKEEKKEPKADSLAVANGEKTKKKDKPICDTKTLIIRHLYTKKEDTIRNVKEYALARDTAILACSVCQGDSVASYQVHMKSIMTDSIKVVSTDLTEVSKMALSHDGRKAAFLSLAGKTTSEQKPWQLHLITSQDSIAKNLNKGMSQILPEKWLVSGDRKPSFSESGNRLFFGICPVLPVKDTMKLEEDIVKVEIWHHDSPKLYTQMETTVDADRKESFDVMYSIDRDTFVQIENPDTEKSLVSLKGDGKYAVTWRTRPYEKAVTWLGETHKDIYIADLETGATVQISSGESGTPSFSPAGKYVYWWSRQDSIWKTFHTGKKTLGVLGLWSVSTFHDEENDVPEKAGPYGIAAWMKNDTAVIVYDRYDLWKLNPEDPFSNICMTDGRMHRQVFRWMKTRKEVEHIDTSDVLLLHRFHEDTKSEAYFAYHMNGGPASKLIGGDYSLAKNVQKADSSEVYLFTKQDFSTFPDLLLGDTQFSQVKKITDVQPGEQIPDDSQFLRAFIG